MSRQSWRAVVEAGCSIPVGRPLGDLTAELVHMLGDPDPELRDDLALSVLMTWIGRGHYDDLLTSLADSVARGLTVGLGDDGEQTVFRRTFAASVVTGCIDRDTVAHLVPRDVFLRWSDLGIGWYLGERDLRGRIPGHGWAHAGARGADLLRSVAASHHAGPDEGQVVLDVISERLRTPTHYTFVDGEEDRLAFAALTVVFRGLVGADALETWVDRMATELDAPHDRSDGPPPAAHNISGFLRAMYAHLAAGISPPDAGGSGPSIFDQPPAARSDLLLALLATIPRTAPWLYSTRRRVEQP
jgi:Protein of unknown function (DUF2785)